MSNIRASARNLKLNSKNSRVRQRSVDNQILTTSRLNPTHSYLRNERRLISELSRGFEQCKSCNRRDGRTSQSLLQAERSHGAPHSDEHSGILARNGKVSPYVAGYHPHEGFRAGAPDRVVETETDAVINCARLEVPDVKAAFKFGDLNRFKHLSLTASGRVRPFPRAGTSYPFASCATFTPRHTRIERKLVPLMRGTRILATSPGPWSTSLGRRPAQLTPDGANHMNQHRHPTNHWQYPKLTMLTFCPQVSCRLNT